MSLTTQTIILGIDDAKISQLSADSSSALTYAASLDVPGIQSLSLSPSYTEKGLKGDEKILDYYIKLDLIHWSFDSAKVSLDVLAVLEGGNLTATGTTPNQVNTYTVSDPNYPNYFKLEAKANYTAGAAGDFHMTLFKCRANSINVTYKTQDYAIV